MDTFTEPPTDTEIGALPTTSGEPCEATKPDSETGWQRTPRTLRQALDDLGTAMAEGRKEKSKPNSPKLPAKSSTKSAEVAKWEAKLNPSNREHVVTELTRLALVSPMSDRTAVKPMLAMYADELAEFPPDVLSEACRTWRRTEKFFPTIAELIALMEPRVKHRRDMLGYARKS